MVEVKQTSHTTTDKAQYVLETSQKSQQISAIGLIATNGTIEGMKRVRDQIDLIAESMVRLSEKSLSIVEIIAAVDELAHQSNLLAVNASIEAAKAGEHGKGFAVVAQEVRNLADQSKQATAQVRAIIGEIEQATSMAATATELGSNSVAAAVDQSTQAVESIQLLAESIGEFAEARLPDCHCQPGGTGWR